ncbi:MFS transporter [Luedemannella flava]
MKDGRGRWLALGAIVLCMLTLGFDGTILNVALPTLATELGAGVSELQWIVDAYILVFAGLLLPAGALADRVGRKRVLLAGLGLFGAASLVATYATSAGTLVGARALMGIGAAVLTPTTLAVLPAIFPPEQRARAVAVAMMAAGVGIPLGPIVGGWLLRHFWWGSVFLVNLPVVAVAAVAVVALIPETRDPEPRPADLVGGALSTVGLVGLIYGVIEVPQRGWADARVLCAIGAGAAVLAAFVWWERRSAYPMIDLLWFARVRFLWGSLAATLATFAMFGVLFVLPAYLQLVLGHDALGVGVRLIPMMAGLIVGAAASERLVGRLGARIPITVGLVVAAVGLGLGARTDLGDGYASTALWLAVLGFGTGSAMAPAMAVVLDDLPAERAGAGTAITMTLRQVGAALGVALLGSLLSGQLDGRGIAESTPAAYVHAMDVVLAACAGLALIGAVCVAMFLRGQPVATAPPGEEESHHDVVARPA